MEELFEGLEEAFGFLLEKCATSDAGKIAIEGNHITTGATIFYGIVATDEVLAARLKRTSEEWSAENGD